MDDVNKQTCLTFKLLPKNFRRFSLEHTVGNFKGLRNEVKVL